MYAPIRNLIKAHFIIIPSILISIIWTKRAAVGCKDQGVSSMPINRTFHFWWFCIDHCSLKTIFLIHILQPIEQESRLVARWNIVRLQNICVSVPNFVCPSFVMIRKSLKPSNNHNAFIARKRHNAVIPNFREDDLKHKVTNLLLPQLLPSYCFEHRKEPK